MLYGASYNRVNNSASLRQSVADGIAKKGLHIIEIETDRARNVALHRDVWNAVAHDLSQL